MDKFHISDEKRNHLLVELLIMNQSQMKVIEALQLIILGKNNPQAAQPAKKEIARMHEENQKHIREWIYATYGPDLGKI